ncbi:MAG TPA: hypothetical protein VFL95_12015 [Gemmatimonadales bacterium]|nr:hypothetical protein [Gemmatimonadales bacterium]
MASSGCRSEGIATTVLPSAIGGITVEMSPSSEGVSGATTPIVPTGSFRAASTAFRISFRFPFPTSPTWAPAVVIGVEPYPCAIPHPGYSFTGI